MEWPIWAPHVMKNLNDTELALYLDFSCTACIPGGGCNVEKALQVLYKSDGNIKLATERLLTTKDALNLTQHDHAIWNEDEVQLFERLIMLHGKNFYHISQDLKTKSVKECVEYYYLWKKSPLRGRENRPPISTPTLTLTPTPTTPPASTSSSSVDVSVGLGLGLGGGVGTTNGSLQVGPEEEQFPCKVCGRVFLKIKSRSAHMKRHKNER